MPSDPFFVSDFTATNQTLAGLSENINFMNKVFMYIVLADVGLFAMICFVCLMEIRRCETCASWYARRSPARPSINDGGECETGSAKACHT